MKIESLERRWNDGSESIEFGPSLNVVVVDDEQSASDFFDGLLTAIAGGGRGRRRLRPELEVVVGLVNCDGRRYRIMRDFAGRSGKPAVIDADTGDLLYRPSTLPVGLDRGRFEALTRVRQSDLWSAASLGMGFESAFKKNALAAGGAPVLAETAARAAAAISGEPFEGSFLAGSPLVWARAREVDLGRRILDARRRHSEVASLRASIRKMKNDIAAAATTAEHATYISLLARQSSLLAHVGRIRSLEEEIGKLSPAPLPLGAERAMEIASEVDSLLARISSSESTAREASARLPRPDPEILQIEARIEELDAFIESSPAPEAPPTPDEIVARAYRDWRRLCGECEAADFAASVARQDAAELAREPSPAVARLARVTTADRLRARLATRAARLHEMEAAERRRSDAIDEIRKAGADLASVQEKTYVARLPLSLLAGVEDAHQRAADRLAELDSIPVFRPIKRRRARRSLQGARLAERALLLQAGTADYESFRSALDEGLRLLGLASDLDRATRSLAAAAAALRRADDELAHHASGAAAELAARLLGDLEKHQSEMAAAEEIREEARLAAETAASLRASREAAATELLARVRSAGIVVADPARAWSLYKLACAESAQIAAAREERRRLAEELEPYREIYADVISAKQKAKAARKKLLALISQIPGCDEGSFERRLGNFTRLRDEALLDQRLSDARRAAIEEYERNLGGKSRSEWEAQLISVEARLSEIEEEHPDWQEVEVTGSEEMLVEAARHASERHFQMERELAAARAELEAAEAGLPDIAELSRKLEETRNEIAEIESVEKRLVALALASTRSARGGGGTATGRRPWKMLPVRVRSSDSLVEFRSEGSAALEPDESDPELGSPVEDYLLSRFALAAAWGPADEHLPLMVEDPFRVAGRLESRPLGELLRSLGSTTQVIVTTTESEAASLCEDWATVITR